MPTTSHVATIAAYAVKESMGGGYRGVYRAAGIGTERVLSPRMDTLALATYWAKVQAHERHAAAGYKLAALRRKGEYLANVWSAPR